MAGAQNGTAMTNHLTEDPRTLLRQVPLLALLPEDDIRALASHGRNRSYLAGEAIFSEGDPADAVHVVVEGSVRIHRDADDGSDVTISVLGPGECIGEQALLDSFPRSASAGAVLDTRTFTVSRVAFISWVTERPKAALALLETMSMRLRQSNDKVADLMFLDLRRRLSKTLISMAEAGAQPGLRVTQAALGQQLGVSRESVNKHLQVFARQGWVALGRGSVTILDMNRLRRFE